MVAEHGGYDADDKEKLYRFEKGLHPGGQEEWWNGLAVADKQMWTALMASFVQKWEKPKAMWRAQDVIIAELMTNCLNHGNLGQYVKDEDGVSVLSMSHGWGWCTNSSGSSLMSGICGMLPVEFWYLMNDMGLNSWEKYLKAVKEVGVDCINDAVKECGQCQGKINGDIFAWHAANPNTTAAQ
ncbi:hypothetical protein B0H10DRAFT_2232648 [Mycena sp. CBHHK59/15]|nr:hypothetical protein B0H10DRAFT_2232648 [Mycena sp. CBHHK59/15]